MLQKSGAGRAVSDICCWSRNRGTWHLLLTSLTKRVVSGWVPKPPYVQWLNPAGNKGGVSKRGRGDEKRAQVSDFFRVNLGWFLVGDWGDVSSKGMARPVL